MTKHGIEVMKMCDANGLHNKSSVVKKRLQNVLQNKANILKLLFDRAEEARRCGDKEKFTKTNILFHEVYNMSLITINTDCLEKLHNELYAEFVERVKNCPKTAEEYYERYPASNCEGMEMEFGYRMSDDVSHET